MNQTVIFFATLTMHMTELFSEIQIKTNLVLCYMKFDIMHIHVDLLGLFKQLFQSQKSTMPHWWEWQKSYQLHTMPSNPTIKKILTDKLRKVMLGYCVSFISLYPVAHIILRIYLNSCCCNPIHLLSILVMHLSLSDCEIV
jgi:hypothetical protein